MAKKKTLTKEEIREKNIETVKFGNEFCPFPTYFFEIGEAVRLGAWKSPVITDRTEDGKYYELTDEKGKTNWFPWYNIHKLQKETRSYATHTDIRLTFVNTSISYLLSKVLSFGVDFEPDYQRDFVWNDEDKELLLDSIFSNIEIGKFVFVNLPWNGVGSPAYQILDGKQRLKTIIDFYLGKISWRGKYYNDLINDDHYWFKNFPVSVAELPESTSKEQILEHFIRLNTTGHVVDHEHMNRVKNMLRECQR